MPAATQQNADTIRHFCGRIAREVGPEVYARFFDGHLSMRLDNDRLAISASTRFLATLVERRFGAVLRDAAVGIPGLSHVSIDFSASDSVASHEQVQPASSSHPHPGRASETHGPGRALADDAAEGAPGRDSLSSLRSRGHGLSESHRRTSQPLSDRYKLEDFIVGDSNRLAYDVAVRVAEGEPTDGMTTTRGDSRGGGAASRSCGPLFIHGLCGLGKTHLLQGIALRFKQRRPGAMVRFTTGESFTNDFIAALHGEGSRGPGGGKNAMERFRRQYRRVDLLCIDDVHFLASKSATQTELLHTFNELELSGSQIVMACDDHPRHVKKFSEALISRFMSGMVVRVLAPDRELCEKIVRQFGERRGLSFDDAALKAMSARVAALPGRGGVASNGEDASARGLSIREIEGLVTRIQACVRLSRNGAGGSGGTNEGVCRVTTSVVQHVLNGMLGAQDLDLDGGMSAQAERRSNGYSRNGTDGLASGRPIKLQSIMGETCRTLGVDLSDFTGTGRQPRVVMARSIVAHLARRLTSLSFPEIARGMGRPSHSTVIAACQRLEKQLAGNDGMEASVPGLDLTLAELCDRLAATISGKRG